VIAAPPVDLAVSPPRLVVAAGETRAIRVTNLGSRPADVSASVAGYRIALRGRPVVLAATSALAVRPRTLALGAGETATVAVTAPADTAPGDRPALVLVSRIAGQVRIRVGVLVLVRGSGRIVHRVVATGLLRRGRTLELRLRNDGNVAERLTRATLRLRLPCPFRVEPRELLPHGVGVLVVRARCRARSVRLALPGARRSSRLRVTAGRR
jgi:hypothetical protein